MNRRLYLFFLLVISIVLVDSVGLAQASRLVPFQARLTDRTGDPVPDGSVNVTFAIYDTATGGVALWAEAHPAVSTTGGYLNVFLGSLVSLDDPDGNGNSSDSVNFDAGNGSRFVGITIDSGVEMVPRHQLVPAFHARTADSANSASIAQLATVATSVASGAVGSQEITDQSITASDFATGAVTSTAIATDAVSGAQIADGSVDTVDLSAGLQGTLSQLASQTQIADLQSEIANLNGPWSVDEPMTFTPQTTGTYVKGAHTEDFIRWRRVGKEALIQFRYVQTTGGTGTTGPILITIPEALSVDTTITGTCTNVARECDAFELPGSFDANFSTDYVTVGGGCSMYNATQFRCNALWWLGTNYQGVNFWGEPPWGGPGLSNIVSVGGWLRVPISGW